MAATEFHGRFRPPQPLGEGVHLWTLDLTAVAPGQGEAVPDAVREEYAALRALLTPEELARADRYHFDRDRFAYVFTRASLRLLLADYFETPAAAWQFITGHAGKPALDPQRHGPLATAIHFNVSHTHGMSAIGLTRRGAIGVDVEGDRLHLDIDAIAQRYLSRYEAAALAGLPAALRRQGFLNAWTRKEAYLKGRGTGLSFPLENFDVSLAPGEVPRLLAIRDPESAAAERDHADHWTLFSANPRPGFTVAAAVRARGIPFSHLTWHPPTHPGGAG